MLSFPFSICHRDLGNVDKMRTSDPDFTDGTEVTGKEQDRVRAMIGQQRGGGRGKRKAKLGSTSWKSAESMRIKHTREERVRGWGSGGWNEYLPSAGEEKACFPPVSFAKSIFEGSRPEQPLRLDAP